MEISFKKITKNNPRKNLPLIFSQKRGETNFTNSFARVYLSDFINNKFNYRILGAKEFKLNGFGIADFVCIYFKKGGNILSDRTSIIAFEMKLSDWKKALSQAFRYKYFANQSIVVLPLSRMSILKKNISIFKMIKVGVWLYDKKTTTIYKIYTPKRVKPFSVKAKQKTKKIFESNFISQLTL